MGERDAPAVAGHVDVRGGVEGQAVLRLKAGGVAEERGEDQRVGRGVHLGDDRTRRSPGGRQRRLIRADGRRVSRRRRPSGDIRIAG